MKINQCEQMKIYNKTSDSLLSYFSLFVHIDETLIIRNYTPKRKRTLGGQIQQNKSHLTRPIYPTSIIIFSIKLKPNTWEFIFRLDTIASTVF